MTSPHNRKRNQVPVRRWWWRYRSRQRSAHRIFRVWLLPATTRNSPHVPIPVEPSRAACSPMRSEEHTSELQSLMRISYAVFCLKKKKKDTKSTPHNYMNIVMNEVRI